MTIEQKAKWFDAAIRFVIEEPVHLVMKSRIEGKSNWAIVDTKLNKVLNSNMEWEDEPPLSKREESFLIGSSVVPAA